LQSQELKKGRIQNKKDGLLYDEKSQGMELFDQNKEKKENEVNEYKVTFLKDRLQMAEYEVIDIFNNPTLIEFRVSL
jgi:hypothetical protein